MILKPTVAAGFASGFVVLFLLAIAPGLVSPASAHKGAHGVVKKRMGVMKEMKGRLKLVGDMVSGKAAYSGRTMRGSLNYIHRHAGRKMTKMFPRGSAHKPSEADPAIWSNWTEFKKLASQLNRQSADFRARLPKGKADDSAMKSMQQAYLTLRKACKSCHDRFRE